MVLTAEKTINEMNLENVFGSKWNISDFENLSNIMPLYRENEFENHIILLLGNTIGNFEIGSMLNRIKDSMINGDLLIIGNALSGKSDVCNPYMNEFINSFLIEVIKQIGLRPSDVEYRVEFDGFCVEMSYVLKKDRIINHLGQTIDFNKGDKIITSLSYKYDLNDFIENLSRLFSFVRVYTDSERSYCLGVCKI